MYPYDSKTSNKRDTALTNAGNVLSQDDSLTSTRPIPKQKLFETRQTASMIGSPGSSLHNPYSPLKQNFAQNGLQNIQRRQSKIQTGASLEHFSNQLARKADNFDEPAKLQVYDENPATANDYCTGATCSQSRLSSGLSHYGSSINIASYIPTLPTRMGKCNNCGKLFSASTMQMHLKSSAS